MQTALGMFRQGVVATVSLTPEVRGAYRLMLLTCGMLVAVFGLTILLIRILRRYRQTYMNSSRKPTPNADVWQQHRLPEDWKKRIEENDKDSP